MVLTEELAKERLASLKEWKRVPPNGSSRMRLSSTGRFGFHVEQLFGIRANNSRNPDFFGTEIKTILASESKSICIGTIPYDEYVKLKNADIDSLRFSDSDPYRKMSKTLFVFYEKSGDDFYKVKKINLVNFDNINPVILAQLDQDYQCLNRSFKKYTYEALSRSYSSMHPSTRFLKLAYKGSRQYVYPNWQFTSQFAKLVYNNAKEFN